MVVRYRWFTILIWVWSSVAAAAEVRVAVAASFAPCLTEIAARFSSETGHHVVPISGATGQHHAQIVAGAPFDVFLAADQRYPRDLIRRGLADSGSLFCYAQGELVLWWPVPPNSLPATLDSVLTSPHLIHLALANPRVAPYGRAAREVLQAYDLWDRPTPSLVIGQSVGQAWQFVASGNAQAGLIARSQIARHPSGVVRVVSADLYHAILQDAVLLTGARQPAAARTFLVFLRRDDVRVTIASYGYTFPDRREP